MNILLIPFFASLALFMMIWLLALWDIKSGRKKLKILPRVSFIIPAYNSQNTIYETINSLFSQDYKGKIEVIVFASGNLDYDFLRYKNLVFMKSKGKVGKSEAVNTASKKARGEILFIVDSDTILRKDALTKVIRRFADEKVGAVSCAVVAKSDDLWSQLQNVEYVMTNITWTSYNKVGSTLSGYGCSMAFRKEAFNDIKGLSDVLSEDFDSALRLVEKKWRVLCEFNAVSETEMPDFFPWFKQRVRWVRGFSLNLINHYKVFLKEPYGLLFTTIYSLLSIAFLANFFINFFSGATLREEITIFFLLFPQIKIPFWLVFLFFAGYGLAITTSIIMIMLYSLLSLPYVLYPYRKKDLFNLPLIFVYSLVYLPLFSLVGVIGFFLAVSDKIRGRKTGKW